MPFNDLMAFSDGIKFQFLEISQIWSGTETWWHKVLEYSKVYMF